MSDRLADAYLDWLEALRAAGTLGTWRSDGPNVRADAGDVCYGAGLLDALAIAAVHNALPDLLAEVREYRAREAAHRAVPPEPEPDPREDLPDDTPVGHGWVAAWDGERVFKPHGCGQFTWWLGDKWGTLGTWREQTMVGPRPATVGDLRHVELPVSEWPDIEAPEPEPEPSRAEKAEAELRARELHHFEAEQSEAKAIAERDNAIAALRAIRAELPKLAVGYVEEGADARSAFREAMHVVDTEARRRNLDMGVATA